MYYLVNFLFLFIWSSLMSCIVIVFFVMMVDVLFILVFILGVEKGVNLLNDVDICGVFFDFSFIFFFILDMEELMNYDYMFWMKKWC